MHFLPETAPSAPPGLSAPTADAMTADPAIPGLSVALDPVRMVEPFERCVLPQALSCRHVELIRFRHRQGERLIVCYRIETQDKATGACQSHVLTGRIHPRRRPPQARPADPSAASVAIPTVTVIPELAMVVDLFPHDKRMPLLSTYAEPGSPALTALLQRLPEADANATGPWTMALMRYRPGLSATLGLTPAQTPPGSSEQYYLKLTSDDELGREIAAATFINDRLQAKASTLRIARPAAWNERDKAALYLPARGRSLQDLAQNGDLAPDLAVHVAAALADLHSLDPMGWPADRTAALVGKIDKACRIVSWAMPSMAGAVEALSRIAQRVTVHPARVLIHGDMKPDHLFVDRADMATRMIDSGSLCIGNPLTDVGALLARMAHLKRIVQCDVRSMDQFCEILQDTYLQRTSAAWRPAMAAARAYGALMIARQTVQARAPDWQEMLGVTVAEELCAGEAEA